MTITGANAAGSEGGRLRRWLGVVLICVALMAAGLPAGSLQLATDPADGSSWLLHLDIPWIPRFGIALELAMDGLSLLLLLLVLVLLGPATITTSTTYSTITGVSYGYKRIVKFTNTIYCKHS